MAEHSAIPDIDHSIGFEAPSFARRALNSFLIPTLNRLPISSRRLIRKTHDSAETVIRYATQYKALEALYNYGFPQASRNSLEKLFSGIWFDTLNAKAVRNRLRIVKREVKKAILLHKQAGTPVRILSIAAGSSRAIIESVLELGLKDDPSIELTFLDKDDTALEYSRILARQSALGCKLEWVCSSAGTHLRNLCDVKFTIVEMVGLMDYFIDFKAIELFDLIYEVLEKDGIFITANINHNSERPFITRIVGWDMIYRTPAEIVKLVGMSRFGEHDVTGYVEPLEIHTVVVAQKKNA